ncbi:lipopolysaccharide glycosyltransferase [Deinococcus irradiatisoli]|uniref:Lipopolysaccharide glycosyltransferase n=1 Tax=Deinococcus irradiatisoli TaxID=2202254 RepID=A0A2Z3JIM8_9DEIO|nr:glycosyltransferase [Deinococcus irradiatisoli]AWN23230.1 lipopolysaccharide glycosyltransferase [Deinococcus irradiatisoli]
MPLSRAPQVAGQVVQASRRPHVALYLADTSALSARHSWLRELVEGLPEVRFRAQLHTGAPASPALLAGFPGNLSGQGGPEGRPETRRLSPAQRATAEVALSGLVTALCLPDVGAFELSLEALSSLSEAGPLGGVLLSGAAAQRVLEAWREVARPEVRPRLPAPSVADALAFAEWLCGVLRGFERPLPQANMGHALGSGEPGLLALHALWRRGTPFVLTEPQVELRRRYLAFRRSPAPLGLKTLQLRFGRLLCRAVYRQASVIVAGSQRVRHWQEHLGASPQRIVVMSSGLQVPSSLLTAPAPEPAGAVVVWCGEVRPDQDLETLLRAFDLVRRQRPEARLRLFVAGLDENPNPELERCRALVGSLRLERQVTFEPAPADWSEAYREGQVVVMSALDEEVPPGLLEAMALGRPIVAPRLGAVPEVLGEAGVLITPRDLLALASSVLRLLAEAPLRRRLSDAARARAGLFSAETWRRSYRQIYDKLLNAEPFGRAAPFTADEFEFGDDLMLGAAGTPPGARS